MKGVDNPDTESKTKKRIVILGAGFGGVYTYKHLHKLLHGNKDVELVLVNDNNYFLFTPMLHEVATGSIAPANIVEPLRKVLGCKEAGFHLGRVESVSIDEGVVRTNRGKIDFDYLVLALGSETNYRDVPGALRHTFDLKTLPDATALKNHLIETFESASLEVDTDKRSVMLHFVVVGGGPTGVEIAAEMADLFHRTLVRYYTKEMMNQVKISLINPETELLHHFPENLREKSLESLEGKGVDVHFGVYATEVRSGGVTLSSGEDIVTNTVVWAAGVKPSTVAVKPEPMREKGRIVVNDKLQAVGTGSVGVRENIYVLGDLAAFRNPGDERPLPLLAQVATRQAKGVARNILCSLRGEPAKAFVYKHQGSLVSLGDWAAVGEIGRFKLFGHLAWWLWRTIYLSKLISTSKKIRVALDWTLNLFSPRDISELHKCRKCNKEG